MRVQQSDPRCSLSFPTYFTISAYSLQFKIIQQILENISYVYIVTAVEWNKLSSSRIPCVATVPTTSILAAKLCHAFSERIRSAFLLYFKSSSCVLLKPFQQHVAHRRSRGTDATCRHPSLVQLPLLHKMIFTVSQNFCKLKKQVAFFRWEYRTAHIIII